MTVEEYIESLHKRFGPNTYMERKLRELINEGKEIKIERENNCIYITHNKLDPILFADAVRPYLDRPRNKT
jgi:hypothetical protein